MSVKMENAPTSAATLIGATEPGRAYRQTHVSTCDSTTATVSRQAGLISNLLLCGQNNAIPLRQLVAITGLPGREIRRRIEVERRQVL